MFETPRRVQRHIQHARARAWLLALCVSLAVPAAAAPPAGTAIDNVATGDANDAVSGLPLAPRSNTVRAIVQPLEALTLVAPGAQTVPIGATATFAHRLTNLGNDSFEFRLDVANVPGDGFDLAGFALVHDRNGNGVADAGDTPVAIGGTVTLAAGAFADLLLSATAPVGSPGPAAALATLTATGIAQGASATLTDTVRTLPALPPPAIAFYAANDFAQTVRAVRLGAPLYVEASAPACDRDPLAPDTIVVTLRTDRSGDQDAFLATETGPSTGRFRVLPSVPVASLGPGTALVGDGIVGERRGDRVTVELAGCGAAMTTAWAWVEPAGITFDARADAPIAGVRVRLIDVLGAGNGGAPGALARVWQFDGVTPAPAEVVTDAAGRFEFPVVDASTYRLEASPPMPYRFPSGLAPTAFSPARVIDAAASYGAPFSVPEDGSPVAVDLPLDAQIPVVLFAEKLASRSDAEIGDELDYTVRVANRSDTSLAAVTLRDDLPLGFAYVAGSARLDGAPLADPAGGGGPRITFALGSIAARADASVRYRVRVGPGTPLGDAVNRAIAFGGGATSNAAAARVRVTGGVFADEGAIVGSVFFDADGDRRASAGEPGLPGVRLWLDDGTWAVTDGEGRYSFTGVSPRTHALKLDPTSLPPAARLVALDHRQGETPGLRFVDLTRGDLLRADFAAVGDTALMRETGDRRIARGGDEIGRVLARGADALLTRPVSGDARALPAAAITTGEATIPVATRPATPAATATIAPATSPAAMDDGALEALLPTLDPDLGFIGLADRDTVGSTQIAVRVKGRAGTRLALRVNGQAIPESRVGRRVTAAAAGLEAWEYLGVALRPGLNVLEVAPPRSYGRVALRLVAPGAPARVVLDAPRAVPADGHTSAWLRLSVTDSAGVPVGARTLVTLESSLGRIASPDIDPQAAGVQVAVEGGGARVALAAPEAPGAARVSATFGDSRASATVEFVPELRPLLAVGTIEGVLAWNGFSRRGPNATPARTGFESEIEQFASERRDGRGSASARGALFVRGRVREDVMLTLGYDSDRPHDMRQFRDLQPDAGYPVLGDASARGYEAQSTGRLYARLDRRGASLLYGDFVTQGGRGSRSLAAYSRSLTGAQTHWQDGRFTVDAFSSRERSRQGVVELRGQGVSGPYVVPGAPFVENSERVEIVVRDRNQPAVVLSASVRQRFTDYELEAPTGRLLFRAPVPSMDADLNPVFVRVTAEVEHDGTPFWVNGAEARARVGSRLEVGGSYVDDHDPSGAHELRSASFAAQLAPKTTLEGEWAQTRAAGGSPGHAGRFELRHLDATIDARLFGAVTALAFDNPGAGFGAGRSEAGGRLTARLAERTRLSSEALFSADAFGRDRRGGLLVALDRTLNDAWRGELGVRLTGQERAARPGDDEGLHTAIRAKLAAQWPRHPEWSGYVEGEQDVRETDRRLAAIGGEYRFHARGRLYARHELISSLSGAWALSSTQRELATVVGVDADLARDAHVFSEYRLADALGGREAQAAVGLRNGWRLANGLRLGTSFERLSPLEGDRTGATTALTGSVDFSEDEQWKGSSRVEIRTSRASDGFLQSLAAAVKLDSAWTGLARHVLSVNDLHASGGEARERLQLGFAWRPGGAWDGLGRWELRYDRDAQPGEPRRRRVANVLALTAVGRVDDHLATSLAWSGKLTRDATPLAISAGGGQWLHGRATLDLARGWDVGASLSALFGRRTSQVQHGLGVELGRQLAGGAWLSAGFNRFGYADDELTGEEWTREGAYLRIRCKFDETLFSPRAMAPPAGGRP